MLDKSLCWIITFEDDHYCLILVSLSFRLRDQLSSSTLQVETKCFYLIRRNCLQNVCYFVFFFLQCLFQNHLTFFSFFFLFCPGCTYIHLASFDSVCLIQCWTRPLTVLTLNLLLANCPTSNISENRCFVLFFTSGQNTHFVYGVWIYLNCYIIFLCFLPRL